MSPNGPDPSDTDIQTAVINTASEFVAHPSENPPGDEHAVATAIIDRLDASPVPFEVTSTLAQPERPNVVARVGDPERGSVLLTGHTDVVPADADSWSADPFDPVVREGRLVGRGTADMKGALAAMIVATEQYYDRTSEPGEVILAFVVDEEHGGAGTQQLVSDGIDADAAVVGEPTEMNVCTAIKGVARYQVSITGESCHSGQPDEGRDAIIGLRNLINRIRALDDELMENTSHRMLSHEDVTTTMVSGGSAPNVVAGTATATVDWRFLPGATDPERFDRRLDEVVEGLTSSGDAVGVDVDRTVFARAAEIDSTHSLVATVLEAARIVNKEAELVGFEAATDARFLLNDTTIPTVHFGPGSITEDAHTVGESVAVEDLVASVEVYESILEELL
jgi:acetylornithine deacetylase/succinyl-diaminopimelate desuccinylase family protein